MVSLDNNLNWNEIRDHDKGGPLKTVLNPFPLTNANYMLIDWLTPVRAIYLPLAHQAGPGYEDLCVYLMIDFRLRQGVQMRNGSGNLVSLTFDRERGLNTRHNDVLSFDLKGIYDYLILPQQLRAPGKGLYRTDRRGDELITLWDRHRPSPSGTVRPVTRPFLRMIDLVTVINDNFGVDVTWQPYEHSNWVVDFLVHVTTLALGFVPGVGPLLAVSFSVGMQVIMDPEGFRNQNPLHLAADVVAALISSGSGPKANLPSGHQRSGAMFLVIKSKSGEPAEPEPPYVKNRGLEAGTDEGKEPVEQKEGDEGNLLEEPKAEEQWEESVEHQVDLEEGAAKPGAEPEEQIAEPVAREEGAQIVEQAVENEPKPKTEEEPDGGGNPVPEVNAKDEGKSNEEEKVDEGHPNASQDIETEKEPSTEQTLDSKETSIPNDKTEDKENGVLEPESKDAVDQPVEAKADEGNPIASQDVETEKEVGAEQSVDSKETSIPEPKAEDKGDRVAEPKIEDEVKQPEQEKVEDEENQAAEPNIKDEDEESEPKIEDEAKPAAEPIAEDTINETADPKADNSESQPAKQPIAA